MSDRCECLNIRYPARGIYDRLAVQCLGVRINFGLNGLNVVGGDKAHFDTLTGQGVSKQIVGATV